MSADKTNVAAGSAQPTVKKARRGVSNQTKAVAQLRFHEKDASTQNGLFIGHLENVSVDWSVNSFSNCACDFAVLVDACACVGIHKASPINIVAMMSFFFIIDSSLRVKVFLIAIAMNIYSPFGFLFCEIIDEDIDNHFTNTIRGFVLQMDAITTLLHL